MGEGPNHAMEQLVRRYWPAVFAYIRKLGHDVHEASDLTQGFVCDVLLGRNLLQNANPTRGKFRSLLLASLQNYVREKHRFESRQKRSTALSDLRFDSRLLAAVDGAKAQSPEHAFSSQWGATLVRRVLDGEPGAARDIVALNAAGVLGFDLYPFILLNLMFSLQAAYAAPLILLAQTRQAERDKVHADADAEHREALASSAAASTVTLLELLRQNTQLTELSQRLTERIEALTIEMHRHLLQRPPQA